MLGLRTREIDAVFDEIIAFAELERFVDQKLKNFSSGMQVRLAFSVAIKAHADVYLMDEVLAVGDMAFQQKCFDVFRQFRREGKTIVLVSHDLASIRNYCEQTLYLKNGAVMALGPTAEVLDKYVYEDREVSLGEGVLGADAAGIRSPVRIVAARVLDRDGRPQRQVVSGHAMTIEIEYAGTPRALPNAMFEIVLSNDQGLTLFAADSSALQGRAPTAPQGKLRFAFPSLAIGAGHVSVAAAARSRDGTTFHRRGRLAELEILEEATARGLVRMPVTVEFVDSTDSGADS